VTGEVIGAGFDGDDGFRTGVVYAYHTGLAGSRFEPVTFVFRPQQNQDPFWHSPKDNL
jgi:hypothetical protein